MAGKKISALPIIATPQLTDIFPVVQSGVTYKETFTQLTSLFATAGVNTNITSLASPALGTPLTVTLTNATGLPMATGVTGGGVVLLGSASASNQATVSFTGLAGASYSEYLVVFDKIVPVSDNVILACRISQSAAFQVLGYTAQTFRFTNAGNGESGAATTYWDMTPTETLGTGSNEAVSGSLRISDPSSTGNLKIANWQFTGIASSASAVTQIGGGQYNNSISAVIDGVQFFVSSGNISSGTFYLYGIRKS